MDLFLCVAVPFCDKKSVDEHTTISYLYNHFHFVRIKGYINAQCKQRDYCWIPNLVMSVTSHKVLGWKRF
jgi:hypothetical protein